MKKDHVPLMHMLIVTFTNAAAGEMKARLRQGLQEAVAESDGEDKLFLLEQLKFIHRDFTRRCPKRKIYYCFVAVFMKNFELAFASVL